MNYRIQGALAALSLVIWASEASASGCERPFADGTPVKAGGSLSLDRVIAEIRSASPEVRAAVLEARALGAEADQAGRRLNPVLSFEFENIAGQGAYNGFDQAETSLTIEQTFLLGNKRALSERASRARAALSSAACGVILREAELEAAIGYAVLVAAIELEALSGESAALAGKLADTVARRVDAGAAAPPELSRARADAAVSKASQTEAEALIEEKRYQLASLWGSSSPDFANPSDTDLTLVQFSASFDHPRLIEADAALEARRAERDSATRAAIPDITVSAGIRRFEDTGDQAVLAGVSVPLPLFDKGRDQTRAAEYRREAAGISRTATEQRLLAEQRAAIAGLKAAQSALDILTTEALPEAESAYSAALRGYEIGRFDLTSALNARTALINVRLAVINARLSSQIQNLRLRSLIGAAPFDGEAR